MPKHQVTTLVMTGEGCSFDSEELDNASMSGEEVAYFYGWQVQPILCKCEPEKKRMWLRFEHREDLEAVLKHFEKQPRSDLKVVAAFADLQTPPCVLEFHVRSFPFALNVPF